MQALELRLLEAALARAGMHEGVRIAIATEVMPGAGLGGSASAAVAILCALGGAYCGVHWLRLAALGWWLELQIMAFEGALRDANFRVGWHHAGGALSALEATVGRTSELVVERRNEVRESRRVGVGPPRAAPSEGRG